MKRSKQQPGGGRIRSADGWRASSATAALLCAASSGTNTTTGSSEMKNFNIIINTRRNNKRKKSVRSDQNDPLVVSYDVFFYCVLREASVFHVGGLFSF